MLAKFMFLAKIAFRAKFLLFRRRLGLFDRQGDLSLIVYRQHFDVDLISHFQKIIYIFDILISDFRNMYETHFLIRKFYECAKLCDSCNGTLHHTAYFDCHAVSISSL